MPDRYEALRAALPGATPGPWVRFSDEGEDSAEVVCMHPGEDHLHDVVIREARPDAYKTAHDDTAYIAAADPDTISALLDERDRYRAALEAIASDRCGWIADAGDGHPSIDLGEPQLIARAALESREDAS